MTSFKIKIISVNKKINIYLNNGKFGFKVKFPQSSGTVNFKKPGVYLNLYIFIYFYLSKILIRTLIQMTSNFGLSSGLETYQI